MQVGILGFGRIGAEHSSWIAAAGSTVAAVVDGTAARRALAEARGFRAFESFDQILNDATIDTVLVATPTSMHFDHAAAALSAGKHVMVEKPFALNAQDAQKLIELAEQNSRVLSVFHNRRWDIDYLTVAKSIRENRFGKLINIESRLGQWSSCVGPAAKEYHPNWRNESAFGGGGLFDWGSHFVDQILQLLLPAKPKTVFAQLQGNVWTKDCDDFARVLINFDNGVAALVEINTTTTKPGPRWHIDGTAGSADSPADRAFDTNAWARLKFQSPDGSKSDIAPAEQGLTEAEIWRTFAAATRGECEPAIPARSVIPTMCVLDAARESARTGNAVTRS